MRPAFLRILIDGKEPELLSLCEAGIIHELNRHPSCRLRYWQPPESRHAFETDIGKALLVTAVSQDGAEMILFDGLVRSVETEYAMSGGCTILYSAIGWSWLLDVAKRCRTFPKMKPDAIARKLLGDRAGEVKISGTHLTLLQYGESDWSFLHRLADRHGCFLRTSGEKVDVLASFAPEICPLRWRSEGGLQAFRAEGRLFECRIGGVNYNRSEAVSRQFADVTDATPAEDSLATLREAAEAGSLNNGLADDLFDKFLSGDHGRFREELQLEARRRRIHSCRARGESREAAIMVGGKVDIDGEIEARGRYGVYRLEHLWELGKGYWNRFWCVPFQAYLDEARPAPSLIRQAPLATEPPLPTLGQPPAAAAPPVSFSARHLGVCVARVLDNNDPEDAARVKVQYPWEEDNISGWAPVAMPHAGRSRGLYFMPEIGDEVLVAFEQGDPNRPVVIGSLWNGVDAPPNVGLHGDEQAANDIKRIVTKSGNRIVLDDMEGKETIVVATPRHIRVSMFEGEQKLVIHSEGDIDIHAGGTVHLRCKQFLREVG